MSEVVDTEVEIQRSRGVARVSQFIDYIFYLIYGIISLEIILDLLGARQANTFREIVDTLAAPFLVPFVGLMNDPIIGRHDYGSRSSSPWSPTCSFTWRSPAC